MFLEEKKKLTELDSKKELKIVDKTTGLAASTGCQPFEFLLKLANNKLVQIHLTTFENGQNVGICVKFALKLCTVKHGTYCTFMCCQSTFSIQTV